MTAPGVLLESSAQMSWAWIGLRVGPAPKLADTRAYADVAEPQRRAQTTARERAWLAGQWNTESHARWELRFSNDPVTRLVSCTLLGRVQDPDPRMAEQAAVRLRDRLAAAPAHVLTEPLLDEHEISHRLAPSPLDGRGSFEVRKRLSWAPCSRRDTGRQVCFAVSPLLPEDRSWEPLWHELARMPQPTVLSVYLEPYAPSPGLVGGLRRLVEEYDHLARPGFANPIWPVPPPPDRFAVRAAPLYVQAAARYTAGLCFRTRISIASQGPVPYGFADLLADTVGGGVVRQTPSAELDAAWRNLAALNRDWLDHSYRQGCPPGSLRDTERILCDLCDLDEAAATFRLPYEVPGHLPLFETAGRRRRPGTTAAER
ncbi:hypothetical protein GCM10010174_29760 [Kutzneria viridogrisea]|uniref:Uncharacterized protein n=2 Tax=Kutzneria TaxID=43356 RepID=W5W9S1_9PSEU|nr:hypothetical protein [Kutzneria albida]AHH97878.1 hypothetical protein KALB_4516 [Kutzneria albida DSM 43870]MBA8924469.1 hypothetical protein [Kutzneria viridogrisea]